MKNTSLIANMISSSCSVVDTHVYIGTPMYGGLCYHGYTSSLINNILDLKKHKINVDWQFIGNESLITRGRNYIADSFLKSSCSHLMFIDADISFDNDAIRKLLESKEDFVCAPYPKKFIDWKTIKQKGLFSNPSQLKNFGASYVINYLDSRDIPLPNKKGLIEIKHAGTGFMLLSREVFKKMISSCKQARASNFGQFSNWYTEYFKTNVDADGVLQSEDWVFCNQWRDLGGKIWLMQDIKLDHIGTYTYEGDILSYGANIT